ncbi:MAG: tetraacyldisaccharide 4'-kinase [Flavobacteriales bacterium]
MPFLRLLLLPVSLLYGLFVYLRNLSFDLGLFCSKEYSVPIISVGNLCSGGSGKSPHVEYILSLLKDYKNIAVLSRGYGRDTSGFKWVDQNSIVLDVGDEPLQILRKFPQVRVAVSENRNIGIQAIIHDENKLIVLDDAFQHRWVKPGLNILLTTYDNLFINDYLLPYGNLRESRKRADRADIIVVTKTPNPLLPLDEYRLKEQISPFYHQKLCYSYINYLPLKGVFSNINFALDGKDVVLFSAIAHSKELVDYVQSKSNLVEHFEFRDHYNFKKKDIQKIIDCFKKIKSEEKLILTTEKDATRLAIFKSYFEGLPIVFLPIEVKFQGKTNFNHLILQYVKQNIIDNTISKN